MRRGPTGRTTLLPAGAWCFNQGDS